MNLEIEHRETPTFWRKLPTWACVLTPLLLLAAAVSLALHVRLGLGHWPEPMREVYGPPAFHIHMMILQGTAICALYSVVPMWALLLCAKPLRLSFRTHTIQLAVYAAVWGLIGLFCALDPWRFVTWLAD